MNDHFFKVRYKIHDIWMDILKKTSDDAVKHEQRMAAYEALKLLNQVEVLLYRGVNDEN